MATTQAAMPWTLALLVLLYALGVILWYVLDPIAAMLVETTMAQGPTENAEMGLATVQTAWDYWPLWYAGMLGTFAIVQANRKSALQGRPMR